MPDYKMRKAREVGSPTAMTANSACKTDHCQRLRELCCGLYRCFSCAAAAPMASDKTDKSVSNAS